MVRKINCLKSIPGTFMVMVATVMVPYVSLINEAYDEKSQNDYYLFYLSSSQALIGASPYWLPPKPGPNCAGWPARNEAERDPENRFPHPNTKEGVRPNLNSPAWVALMMPLSHFKYNVAWVIYSVISVAFGLASVVLITHLFVGTTLLHLLNVLLLFFFYYPSYANVEYGQVSFFLLLPLVFSWMSIERGRNWLCGFILGFLAGLKVFFLLFALSFFVARKLMALFGMLGGFLVTFIIGGYFVGFEYYDDYYRVLGDVWWLASSWNASISGFYTRILDGYLYDYPTLVKPFVMVSSVLILAGLAYCIRISVRGRNKDKIPDIVYAGTVPAMLLLSPLGWLYYFPLLSISLAIMYRRLKGSPNKRVNGLLIMMALSMSSLPSVLVPACDIGLSVFDILWKYSLPFYSLLILFITILVVLRKRMGEKTLEKSVI